MRTKLHQGFLFGSTIFVSAFLLFQVQPLISKYILPWYGGTPAVWTTALLFFQLFLVAGYAYADLSIRYLPPRAQTLVHIALLLAAAVLLPIAPANSWKPASALQNPTGHILLLLATNVGPAYVLLASTSPLLQAWFSRLNPGRSPYRFYALSNVGSLLALLSYPVLIEPGFTLRSQIAIWSAGFVAFALGSTLVAVLRWRASALRSPVPVSRSSAIESHATPDAPSPAPPPRATHRLLWLALPAAASVMLLAVTNQMTMQVAVIPFLWILPLSLYLLSFILCFENRRFYPRILFVPALIAAMLALLYVLSTAQHADLTLVMQIVVYSAILFVCCMVCHGELARLKPHPRHLTAFYLMVSIGGALGGIFVAVIAPLLFRFYFELHVGAILCLVLPLAAFLAAHDPAVRRTWRVATVTLLVATVFGVGFALYRQASDALSRQLDVTRNFYGITWVEEHRSGGPEEQFDVLVHDGVDHGSQYVSPQWRCRPTSYFVEHSGVGMAIRSFPRQNLRIGVVGMGIGVLASYAGPGDTMRFYEINPAVARLAAEHFTFTSECTSSADVVLGDGRLSLETEVSQQFDILVLDAFRGVALPVHLLTVEAFEIYLRHLKPDGVIVVQQTNAHLNLKPVFWKMADHFGLQSLVILTPYEPTPHQRETSSYAISASWMLLTRNSNLLAALPTPPPGALEPGAHAQVLVDPIKGSAFVVAESADERATLTRVRLWSDDYSNPFQLLKKRD